MKRRIIIGAAATLLVVACLAVFRPGMLGLRPYVKASAAVLLDVESGEIWMDVNGDRSMPPASISKLMTEMIVLDHISTGRGKWEDRVQISAYASTVGGATLSLNRGESYSVRELFEAISVYSANDAAVALAEYTAGSENSFVVLMNEKARSLGLSSGTVFANSSGLAAIDLGSNRPPGHGSDETMMTARDTAVLAAALIRSYPEILNISNRTQMQIKGRGLYVSNTNLMLPAMGGTFAYEGTDGLKTGFDKRSGYCIAGTAQRDGQRLVAVVMGSENREWRFEGAAKMFDYGFYVGLSPSGKIKHILSCLGSLLR